MIKRKQISLYSLKILYTMGCKGPIYTVCTFTVSAIIANGAFFNNELFSYCERTKTVTSFMNTKL
uniref:Uncharacterized protein n=1 Tax=Romanomermis culicivorax TaxID=13658 RepID=A0A915HYH9_ROMCU